MRKAITPQMSPNKMTMPTFSIRFLTLFLCLPRGATSLFSMNATISLQVLIFSCFFSPSTFIAPYMLAIQKIKGRANHQLPGKNKDGPTEIKVRSMKPSMILVYLFSSVRVTFSFIFSTSPLTNSSKETSNRTLSNNKL